MFPLRIRELPTAGTRAQHHSRLPQWPSLRRPLALPRATKDLKNRPAGTSWWDKSLQGRRGCLPQPQPEVSPFQFPGSQESTHSVGGTVGSMFVLCGLVPLVSGHSMVHEPETRGTIPGNSVTEFPDVLKTSAPTGGKRRILPSLLPSLSLIHFFGLSNILCLIPNVVTELC